MAPLLFQPIQITDRDWMTDLLKKGHRGSLEYNFTSNFIWRNVYKLQAARLEDHLLLRSQREGTTYVFPSGSGDLAPALQALAQDAKAQGVPMRFNTVLEGDKQRLENLYPGQFRFQELREFAEYVYDAQSLITLRGKKLSSKRNHINRFRDNNPDWQYEPLTEANIDQARQMHMAWCKDAGCQDEPDLFSETCAVKQAFDHFFDLHLQGGLIRAGGRVVAFTMGEALNDSIYLVHIEKAFPDIQGAYQMINQQFAMANAGNYQYIDREDDAGDEGLRRAKMSYEPAFLIAKYSAELAGTLG